MTDREVMSVLHESHVWSQPVVGGGQLSHQLRRQLIQVQRPLREQKPAPAKMNYSICLSIIITRFFQPLGLGALQ